MDTPIFLGNNVLESGSPAVGRINPNTYTEAVASSFDDNTPPLSLVMDFKGILVLRSWLRYLRESVFGEKAKLASCRGDELFECGCCRIGFHFFG